jgi:hypothetical protein
MARGGRWTPVRDVVTVVLRAVLAAQRIWRLFCPHCGKLADVRVEPERAGLGLCPRCRRHWLDYYPLPWDDAARAA